jgi:hypothetical protein
MLIPICILSAVIATVGVLKGHFEALVFFPIGLIALESQVRLRQVEKRLGRDRPCTTASPSGGDTLDWIPVRSADDVVNGRPMGEAGHLQRL